MRRCPGLTWPLSPGLPAPSSATRLLCLAQTGDRQWTQEYCDDTFIFAIKTVLEKPRCPWNSARPTGGGAAKRPASSSIFSVVWVGGQ